MGQRARSGPRERTFGFDSGREAQDRAHIAQVAARLIADHGISDWSLAKRKAARQLMLPDRSPLPGDDEIEAALAEHHALFGGEEHQATLRGQREEALRWMRNLAAFAPRLVGGVAEGWATEHSDIRLELVADDAKSVEIELINHEIPYKASQSRDDVPELYIDTPRGGVRLIVRTFEASRQRPRRDREATRLDAKALEELLKASG